MDAAPRPTMRLRPLAALPLWAALCLCLGASCAEEARGLEIVGREGDRWVELSGTGPERPTFVDFGRVPSGTVVTHTFFLRNADPVPVDVERVDASCGCTVPTVLYRDEEGGVVHGQGDGRGTGPVLTLPPGAVAEVTLRVDTRHIATKNVDKLNFVRITSTSDETPYLQLEAHVIAEQPFHATPDHVDFGKIAQTGGGVGTTRIARPVESDVRLVGLANVPDEVVATLEEEWVGGVRVWTLRAEIVAALDVGAYRSDVELALETVEGAPYPSFRVPLRATVVPDLEVQPRRLHLGTLGPEEGGRGSARLLCNLPGHRVKILSAEIEGDAADLLEASWSPASRDAEGRSDEWEVRLEAAPGIDAEVVQGTLRLELDDPSFSPVEIPYAGIGRAPADE